MEALSVREYRNNLASAFDRADQGEQVLIRRKNSIYILTSAGKEDITLTPQKQQEIDKMTESLRRSIQEIKESLDGNKKLKKARDIVF